jgi:formylglycine-generating enzyme required for sulfatase activity
MTPHLQHLGPLSFRLLPVPGGSFRMGSRADDPEADDDEKPDHEVRVSDFYLGEYPVTQDLWLEVMGENPAYFQGPRRPVERVSWDDTQDFIQKLNTRTKEGRPAGHTYCLPTEAEWEYAAHGGSTPLSLGRGAGGEGRGGVIFSGSDKLKEVGWFLDNSHSETKPVGLKPPNALGLYDMSGNVWEWCGDCFDAEFYKKCAKKGLVIDPCNRETGSFRVRRGGSWLRTALRCRSAHRNYWDPDNRNLDVGFRLCLAPQ